LETGADDLYGQWEAMFVTHSAAFRSPDSRPEPFPFEMHELPEEVEKLTGMHVYKTSLRPFEPDMLVELIEQIL
jgi:hypothetical protein